MQSQSGGPATAPPGGLLAQALTERKPLNQSANYVFNNFNPMGSGGRGSPGFQQAAAPSGGRMAKQDPELVQMTLTALKKYKSKPEELKRVFNENPEMRAVLNQLRQGQMAAPHGQYNTATAAVNLHHTANPRTMVEVHQQQQFINNSGGLTESQWGAQALPSKVSPPLQRGLTHQGNQFGIEPQQQMYINHQQPQDLWMAGDQVYSGVPPNRGVIPPPPPQQHHHQQMTHTGPPPYHYGRPNVDNGIRMGYTGGLMGTQGDFSGSTQFPRYHPHPGGSAGASMFTGQRHQPPQTQPPVPPMGSPNGTRLGYDESGQIQMTGGRQNVMSGAGAGGVLGLRHEHMAAARGRLTAVAGPGIPRPPPPPTQMGSPKGMSRRQHQEFSTPQYQLQQQSQQQHETVNGGLMNGGNYQVVGAGGGTNYNPYQNQTVHQQPYNDPHQQHLNEQALGIDKFMMQQQHHLQSNGNGNDFGNGSGDSFNKPATSSSASLSNQWKMNADEHRKIMLSNLNIALREQNEPSLLSMVDSVEAQAFRQCDTQSQYDYRLARWLAAVLDKVKATVNETAPVSAGVGLTTEELLGVQEQKAPGPPLAVGDGSPTTTENEVVRSPRTAIGNDTNGGGAEEGGDGNGNCGGGGGPNNGTFAESSLSVKNPILANLLPAKSGSDAVDNSREDTSFRLSDQTEKSNSNVSMSTAAGPITALTPPSSSESLPSSSPPQTTMASPKSQSSKIAAAVPVPAKYAKLAPAAATSFSSSSSSSPSSSLSSLSTARPSNASAISPSGTIKTSFSAATGSSSSTASPSSSAVLSTFQSPSLSNSSTFSVPTSTERQVAVTVAATAACGGGSSNGHNGGARRASSAASSGNGNGVMNKSGNTNPHSVDSGIGSPPRSITSSSLYSPKIQQGTSPSLATIPSDVGASPEK